MKQSERLTILVVEDEAKMRDILSSFFKKQGFTLKTAATLKEARQVIESDPIHLVISDIRLSPQREEGLELLRWIKNERKAIPVILVTAYGRVRSAVQAVKEGAYDYIEKPFDLEELLVVTKRALENVRLRLELEQLKASLVPKLDSIIGKSKAIQDLRAQIAQIACSSANVLITGESGTGKELVGRAIHQSSPYAHEPFVAVNCAAFPENLLESELFGHRKGAFTDAKTDKPGLVTAAGKGVLFLDEIAEMPISLQSKLLRLIEQKEFYPLGSTTPEKFKARIISATNKNLKEYIKQKKFREDLLFRLRVIHIHLPPLRERKEDIPLLAQYFLEKCMKKYRKDLRFAEETYQFLLQLPYPGNVRELQNLIEAAVAMSQDGEEIKRNRISAFTQDHNLSFSGFLDKPFNQAKDAILQAFTKEYFERLLDETGGNISEAARRSGVHRRQLQRYLKKLMHAQGE